MSSVSAARRLEGRLYGRLIRRRFLLVGALALLSVCCFLMDIATGPSSLGVLEALRVVFHPAGATSDAAFIVWSLRLPQACLAILIGLALGVAGIEMQSILGNSLADPFTMGVSSAAALGAALAIVLGIGLPGVPESWLVPANAFLFASASLFILVGLARAHVAAADRLVLFGVAMGFSCGALLALLQFVASPDALQQLIFWSMGSLVRANWSSVAILAVALALTLPGTWMAASGYTLLVLGEEEAAAHGVDVARLRHLALLRISLLAALSVAFAGIIGFIGLTGPHVARLLVGEDRRFLVPASAFAATIVMSLAATASKAVIPGIVIPIGIITALIGLPIFIGLLLYRGRAT